MVKEFEEQERGTRASEKSWADPWKLFSVDGRLCRHHMTPGTAEEDPVTPQIGKSGISPKLFQLFWQPPYPGQSLRFRRNLVKHFSIP
jgi:hypothetical protein